MSNQIQNKGTAINIMIIDDDPMIRRLVSRMLATKKFDTITAEGGEMAMQLLSENDVSHIILDLNMPDGLSGTETLKRINKLYPNIPVILSSGDGSSLDKEKFKRLGVSKFLNKPFDLNELFSVIV